MTEIIEHLLDEVIQTKEQADRFITQLDEMREKTSGSMFSFSKICEDTLSVEKKEKLLYIFKELQINISDKHDVIRGLESIQKIFSQKSILKLILAREANHETITRIRMWCAQELHTTPLLDISMNNKLLGGCIIRFGGYYKDYSLKKTFEEKKHYLTDAFIAHA